MPVTSESVEERLRRAKNHPLYKKCSSRPICGDYQSYVSFAEQLLVEFKKPDKAAEQLDYADQLSLRVDCRQMLEDPEIQEKLGAAEVRRLKNALTMGNQEEVFQVLCKKT